MKAVVPAFIFSHFPYTFKNKDRYGLVDTFLHVFIQGDQKVSVHLMITIQEVAWLNLTAWQLTARDKGTLDSH
jgi:hypothetical protein